MLTLLPRLFHCSDHPSYCRNDPKALYLGQKKCAISCSHLLAVVIHMLLLTFAGVLRAGCSHIAYAPHRKNPRFFAKGFQLISDKWDGKCSYCGKANQGMALCNIPVNSHSWKKPSQFGGDKHPPDPGFVCGREDTRVPESALFFTQITWAGGKGCKGNSDTDKESTPGTMCVQGSRQGGLSMAACDKTEDMQVLLGFCRTNWKVCTALV